MTTHVIVACHVLANLLWIGSIIAVGLLVARSSQPDSAGFGKAASTVYRTISASAFGASFVFALILLVREPGYLKMPWLHVKLTAALIIIALHHVIGARAKRAADGTLTTDGGAKVMTIVLAACAAVAVFMAIVKPF